MVISSDAIEMYCSRILKRAHKKDSRLLIYYQRKRAKENYNSLQVVPSFSFGITEWDIFDIVMDNTTEQYIQNYIGEENCFNDVNTSHSVEIQQFLGREVG